MTRDACSAKEKTKRQSSGPLVFPGPRFPGPRCPGARLPWSPRPGPRVFVPWSPVLPSWRPHSHSRLHSSLSRDTVRNFPRQRRCRGFGNALRTRLRRGPQISRSLAGRARRTTPKARLLRALSFTLYYRSSILLTDELMLVNIFQQNKISRLESFFAQSSAAFFLSLSGWRDAQVAGTSDQRGSSFACENTHTHTHTHTHSFTHSLLTHTLSHIHYLSVCVCVCVCVCVT